MVDVLGLILIAFVHSADIQDRNGAKRLLWLARKKFRALSLIWADGGYTGKLIQWARLTCNYVVEIVKKSDDQKGFQVLPRRWVVERTFAWLGRYRRHSKDYEYCTKSSEAMIFISMIQLMLVRLHPA